MSISRRGFFRSGASEAARGFIKALETVGRSFSSAMEERAPKLAPYLRPPGALDEPAFLDVCTRCDDCIRVCPHWAIRKAGYEYGPKVRDTPIILADKAPCYLCADFPCIAACEPKALLPVSSAAEVRMGLARVDATTCYATQGNVCDVCEDQCPTTPKAITVELGSPARVDDASCTGCGICAHVCPPAAIQILAAHTL